MNIVPGIKIASSLGAGPEARCTPMRKEVIPNEVKNKQKPSKSLVPAVPGVTYTPVIPG